MAEEGGGHLLVVVLETHAAAWSAAATPTTTSPPDPGLDPATLVSHVGALVGAHEMDAPGNTAVVLGVHEGQCPVLYLSPALRDYDAPVEGGPATAPVGDDDHPTVASALAGSIAALAAAAAGSPPSSTTPPPSLAAALARAVCLAARHCPRVASDGGGGGEAGALAAAAAAVAGDAADDGGAGRLLPGDGPAVPSPSTSKAPRPRICVIAATPGAADAYVPVMNAVFAAQRLGTPIDAVVVGPTDAGVLQQAAHLTGGLYLKPRPRTGLAQALLTAILPRPRLRPFLSGPRAGGVDLRASCFCHWQPVDVGHVCSVCLSIFCGPRAVCDTCGVIFKSAADAGAGVPGEKRAEWPSSSSPTGGGRGGARAKV